MLEAALFAGKLAAPILNFLTFVLHFMLYPVPKIWFRNRIQNRNQNALRFRTSGSAKAKSCGSGSGSTTLSRRAYILYQMSGFRLETK